MFHVIHGTTYGTGIGSDLAKALLQNAELAFRAYWTVQAFLEKGFDVQSVSLDNYTVYIADPNDKVNYPHWAVSYDLTVKTKDETDPIPVAIVYAIAVAIAIAVIAGAIAYTLVRSAPVVGPVIGGAIGVGIIILALAAGERIKRT